MTAAAQAVQCRFDDALRTEGVFMCGAQFTIWAYVAPERVGVQAKEARERVRPYATER
ncbi:hypothetical protein LDO31_06055 [Luteimonas sp. XNQY3]|nr:hypothetical protein [Luteimonas sp. XNQY3]